MRSVSSTTFFSLLIIMLFGVATPARGTPQGKRKDGGSSGSGNSNSGIPSVANAKNAAGKPLYGARDAIMGGIYHGRCNNLARASVRLAFHDAGTYQLADGLSGGADGSMLTDSLEVQRAENNGLQNITAALLPLPAQFGLSPGDILHLAGVLGVMACPGGPAIKTYVGRKHPPVNYSAPDGRLINPNSPVKKLTAGFAAMGFSIRELMALIGAHSTGRQRFQDAVTSGNPLDSTVDIWEVRFCALRDSERNGSPGTFRLASDVNFAHNATTQKDYSRFVGNQDNWQVSPGQEYAAAHEKMSLLGFDKNTLTDCSEVLPLPIDLKNTYVATSGKQPTDPTVDAAKLEAQIQQYRALWV
ncbi:heme peroxidase [Mycena capillaripes]|nr:heme peroxidase [Mycena capillaripes]